jgi:tRNA(adenine34) deaminase
MMGVVLTNLPAANHLWDRLLPPWQACLEEAWLAYGAGSVPIGAVVTDGQGRIIGRGRNRIGDRAPSLPHPAPVNGPARAVVAFHDLAHAELNALLSLNYVYENESEADDPHRWVLYTTMEPCPLCLGAFYMSGLRELHYASRDPYAGSVNLLGATPYLSRKPIRVVGPHPELEIISTALTLEWSMFRESHNSSQFVRDHWRLVLPAGVGLGERLFERQVMRELQARNASVSDMAERVAAEMVTT